MKVQKDSGKFLTAEDVTDQELVTFTNEGKEEKGQWGTRLQIGLKTASDEDKVLTLNPTSKNALIDQYGDDTAAWVGKQARVHVIRALVGSEMKRVIYLTHPNFDLEGAPVDA